MEVILKQRRELRLQLHRDKLAEEQRARSNAHYRQKHEQFGRNLALGFEIMDNIRNGLVPKKYRITSDSLKLTNENKEAKALNHSSPQLSTKSSSPNEMSPKKRQLANWDIASPVLRKKTSNSDIRDQKVENQEEL